MEMMVPLHCTIHLKNAQFFCSLSSLHNAKIALEDNASLFGKHLQISLDYLCCHTTKLRDTIYYLMLVK
jgi:hypothetical protein